MGTIIVLDNITRHFSNFHFIANVQAFINCRIMVSDGASSGEVIWTALPVSFMLVYGQCLPWIGYINTMYNTIIIMTYDGVHDCLHHCNTSSSWVPQSLEV